MDRVSSLISGFLKPGGWAILVHWWCRDAVKVRRDGVGEAMARLGVWRCQHIEDAVDLRNGVRIDDQGIR